MKAPKIPYFFKSSEIKKFTFKPRYYDEIKERYKQLNENKKSNIKFKRIYSKRNEKGRNFRIIFLIIILSLLAYKFIIN